VLCTSSSCFDQVVEPDRKAGRQEHRPIEISLRERDENKMEKMMKVRRLSSIAIVATLAVTSLSAGNILPAAAIARSLPLKAGQFVNVNVGFSTHVPLPDVDEQTLIDKQQTGRTFIYKMASKECAILKATIAKTCRLTNLNVSAQIREQYNQTPIELYLNGNAQFVITLKDEEAD
jgi:hypothetical protein